MIGFWSARLRERDEGGVIMILTGILLTALVSFTALAVDIGHESATKRKLHLIADLAAQDALFALGGAGAFAKAVSLASASALSNDHPQTGANTLAVEIGTWSGSTFLPLSPACKVTLPGGSIDECDPEASANAVRVVAGTTQPWYLARGAQKLSASAVSTLDGLTGIQIGTFAARIGLGPGAVNILDQFFGVNTATFTAASYQGIATSTIKLGDLATALGFASPSTLLAGSVKYSDLVSAESTVLNNSGQSSAAASLGLIATSLANTTRGNTVVSLGQIANAAGGYGNGSALAGQAGLNAFDLLIGGFDATALNGGSAIGLNNVNLSAPNIGSVQLNARVLQAPKSGYGHACGLPEPPLPTSSSSCADASSAQADSQAIITVTPNAATSAAITTATTALALAGITFSTKLTIPVYTNAASGHAWVTKVYCGNTNDHQAPVDAYAHTGVLHLALGQDLPLSAQTSQTDLTSAGGASTTTTIAGQTISSATLVGFNLTVPGLGTQAVNVKDLATVDILGSPAGLVHQTPVANPDRSFTGPFERPVDPYGAGNVVPAPTVSSGNALQDAGSVLASQLPNGSASATSALNAALTGTTLAGATQTTVSAALAPVVTAAVNEINGIVAQVGAILEQQLAGAIQIGLGGADVANLRYFNLIAPDGTYCLRPEIVQ